MDFNTEKMSEIVQSGTKVLVKHAPKLLTAAGIAGFFTTVVLTARAKPKADELIKEAKAIKAAEANENGEVINLENVKLTPFETVKAVTPAYWPVAASFVLSAVAVIGSDYISDKRQVALTAAYTIADTSLKELQKKNVDILGQKKAAEIEQKITQDKVNGNPPSTEQIRFVDSNSGYSLFMAPYTEEVFCARIDDVKDVFVRANERINSGDEVMLNDILYDLNGRAVSVSLNGRGVSENTTVGTMFYWNEETGLINYHFSAANVPGTDYVCNKIVLDTTSKCAIDPRRLGDMF